MNAEANKKKRFKPSPSPQGSESDDSGILNERILLLVFQTIKWDLRTLCTTASLNRKLASSHSRKIALATTLFQSSSSNVGCIDQRSPQCSSRRWMERARQVVVLLLWLPIQPPFQGGSASAGTLRPRVALLQNLRPKLAYL